MKIKLDKEEIAMAKKKNSSTVKRNLSTVLSELMSEEKLTSSELARQTGVGQPVIHRMMKGKSPNPKVGTLAPLTKRFKVTTSQLLGEEPISTKKSIYVEVPLLEWSQVKEWPQDKENVEVAQIVATDREVGENAFALKVKDSTMLPRFPEDSVIIVDPDREPKDRDFAVTELDGQSQVTFKQMLIDGGDVYLKPLNPEFKTHMLNDRDYKVKGIVVQARINL